MACRCEVIRFARGLPGIEAVHDKGSEYVALDLPADREGDVVVISDAGTALAVAEARHDPSVLQGHWLRSHGGLAERRVPFILSAPLNDGYAERAASGTVHSYEIFDYAINGV